MACGGFVYSGTEITFLITEYSQKKMLAELGYTQDLSTLEQWEVQAYSVIGDAINEWSEKRIKKKGRG